MKLTTNYNLKKPELTDPADITEINSNYDTIDTELKNRRLATALMAKANLNQLLENKSYACVGTITNAPITANTCLVDVFAIESRNTIIQVCHVINTDNSTRSFVRSIVNGNFGAWVEFTGTDQIREELKLLISENSFKVNTMTDALVHNLATVNIDVFDDVSSFDIGKGGTESFVLEFYEADRNTFHKTTNTALQVYLKTKTVTTGANEAWVYVDFDNIHNGGVIISISRDNGATFTDVSNRTLTSISSQPAGQNIVIRLTLVGDLRLKNIAWGVK